MAPDQRSLPSLSRCRCCGSANRVFHPPVSAALPLEYPDFHTGRGRLELSDLLQNGSSRSRCRSRRSEAWTDRGLRSTTPSSRRVLPPPMHHLRLRFESPQQPYRCNSDRSPKNFLQSEECLLPANIASAEQLRFHPPLYCSAPLKGRMRHIGRPPRASGKSFPHTCPRIPSLSEPRTHSHPK